MVSSICVFTANGDDYPLSVDVYLLQLEAADVSDNDWKDRDQLSPSVQFCLYSIKAWGKFCRAYPNRLSPSRVNAPVIRKYHDKLKECISDSSQHLADLE